MTTDTANPNRRWKRTGDLAGKFFAIAVCAALWYAIMCLDHSPTDHEITAFVAGAVVFISWKS